jgi:hypothetical protein
MAVLIADAPPHGIGEVGAASKQRARSYTQTDDALTVR